MRKQPKTPQCNEYHLPLSEELVAYNIESRNSCVHTLECGPDRSFQGCRRSVAEAFPRPLSWAMDLSRALQLRPGAVLRATSYRVRHAPWMPSRTPKPHPRHVLKSASPMAAPPSPAPTPNLLRELEGRSKELIDRLEQGVQAEIQVSSRAHGWWRRGEAPVSHKHYPAGVFRMAPHLQSLSPPCGPLFC